MCSKVHGECKLFARARTKEAGNMVKVTLGIEFV
jgi:hypothetical protein